jgi:hypothetical protein
MREIPPDDEKPKRNWLGMGSRPPSPKPDPKPKPKPESKPKHSAERERRQVKLAQNARSHTPSKPSKKESKEGLFWGVVLISVLVVWYVFFI